MLDPLVGLTGLLVGIVVGLTGMGGGALMTPILVLLFGVEPLSAVSSDIVAAVVMKPIGGIVHWRHGTVRGRLVLWLMLGSVPSAFLGVALIKWVGPETRIQGLVKVALGVALLAVAVGLVVRPLLQRRSARCADCRPFKVSRIATLAIGVVGGLVVGMTSVGSGSLMIVMLLLLYPRMLLSDLVGTDLVQAIPLVASAALAHLIFGRFHLALTASILVGSVPGVFIGARLSARAPDHLIRPALLVVLTASGLKLLEPGNLLVGVLTGVVAIAGGARALAESQHAKRREFAPAAGTALPERSRPETRQRTAVPPG